jgi:putative endopeptidase
MKKLLYIPLAVLLVGACKETPDTDTKRVFITGIDPSKKPGDDFFTYANGIWYDSAQIPASQTGVGSYSFLNFPQRIRMQGILDSVSKASNVARTIEQKVGDFYTSGLDLATINKRGYEPIKPILARIDAIADVPTLITFVAEEQKVGDVSIIGFRVGADSRRSSVNIVNLSQTGIGLPERDYYFRADSSTLAIQAAYKKYIATLFELTGTDAATAAKNAEVAYEIEKQIATSHKTNIERRNVQTNYNKLAVADIAKKQPNIGWVTLLNDLGTPVDSVNMLQPAYYDKLNALLKSVSISDWKIYLKAKSISAFANFLSEPFADASFAYSKILTGQAVRKPRPEEITEAVDRSLGHALAQLYVKKYFPEEAKKRMRVLVDNLKRAFEARITRLDWMSDSTKTKAKEKLYAFTEKIGYPDKWREYSNVEVNKDTYFENRLSANRNDYLYNVGRVGKPVDRTEWGTTPPTVTAYNNSY